MNFQIGKYKIELEVDETYTQNSADNIKHYQEVYFDQSEYDLPTKIGVQILQNDKLIKSVIIGSVGGGSGIHLNSQIIEDDRILICCSDSVFCLSIPDLDLKWKTQVDQATCFEIFKKDDSYIIHGEMEISKLDSDGRLIWQQSGADIFTTEKGTNDFEITESYIRATDWENRTYKFDFNGKVI